MSISGIDKRQQKIFGFTVKNIGTNSIRKNYITYLNNQKQLSVYKKDKIHPEDR